MIKKSKQFLFIILLVCNYASNTTQCIKTAALFIQKINNRYLSSFKAFSTRKNYEFITFESGKRIKIIDEDTSNQTTSAVHYTKDGAIKAISLSYPYEGKHCIIFLSPSGSLERKCIKDKNEEYIERYYNGKRIMQWLVKDGKLSEIHYCEPIKKPKKEKTQYNISQNGLFDLSNIAGHKPPYYDSTGFTIDPTTHIEIDTQGKPTNPAFSDIILFD